MKNISFLVLFSFITGCQAEPSPPKPNQFEKVFTVVSSDKIFSTSFTGLMKQLDTLCKPNTRKDSDIAKDGNVECAAETGVKEMDVAGTETPAMTIITGTFVGLDKCEYMRQTLIKKYGKPADSSGTCNAHWKLKPGKNGRQKSVGFESSKDNKLVYFTIGEDQG